MAGIYLHIPFCRRKCPYCNFFSLATGKYREEFLDALRKEIDLTKDYLAGQPVETIYIGGGTPSLINPSDLDNLLPSLFGEGSGVGSLPSLFGEGSGERSLELNPEDITETYLPALQATSFNRFSLGVQSFHEAELTFLGRSHGVEQSIRAVRLLQDAGYTNISIDLIYGIPGTTIADWQNNLETALSLDVPHISAYALTVEQKTPLAWMISHSKIPPVSDTLQAEQFKLMMGILRENGYLHYEISNFCKPGMQAIHNTNYWRGVPYLGLGPSAHSYNGHSRRWNVSNLSQYIAGMREGKPLFEEEQLTVADRYNEYVMTSLRTMWGCASGKLISDFGSQISEFFTENSHPFIARGLMTEKDDVFYLTDEGKFFADRIASELFITG